MEKLISPEYLTLLKEMHNKAPWGTKGHKYYGEISAFADRIGARSILDYGCGQATLEREFKANRPDIRIDGYDPAIENREKLIQADLVTSTDVFEHIESDCIAQVIDHISKLAERGILLVIAVGPAKRFLPDGRNAHILIQKPDLWCEQLTKAWSSRWHLEFKKQKALWVRAIRK